MARWPDGGDPGPGSEEIQMNRYVLSALVLIVLGSANAQLQQKPDQKWDVAADFGPSTKMDFETSEGTWMNLDASPDGKRIVFDLLGDIYVMPIDGSAKTPATRITSGPVFDMQPKFSPDGK